MAARNTAIGLWLKERLSCPVCSEMVDEPHSLSCLHTLCKGCLNDLDLKRQGQTNGYICPVCKDFCAEQNVRKNFFINELLDLYKMLTTAQLNPCKQCNANRSTHRCVECRSDYCPGCKIRHDSFAVMSNHHMIPTADIEQKIIIDKLVVCPEHANTAIELNCVDCEKPICRICNAVEHKNHNCETTAAALKRLLPDIKHKQEQIVAEVKYAETQNAQIKARAERIYKSIENMEIEAKEAHRKLRDRIDRDLVDLLAQLNEVRFSLKQEEKRCTEQISAHARSSCDVANCVDTILTVAKGTSLLVELQSGVKVKMDKTMAEKYEKRNNLPTVARIRRSGIFFQAQTNSDASMIGNLKHESNSGLWPCLLDQFRMQKPKQVSEVKLNASTEQRFSVIGDAFWIPTVNNGQPGIMFLPLNGETQRFQSLPNEIDAPKAIVSFEKQSAVIASKTGVYLVSQDGNLQTLHTGNFSDACFYRDNLFALEWKEQCVYFFIFVNGGLWMLQDKIKIEYNAVNDWFDQSNTLLVVDNHIYVYAMGEDKLYQYSMDGKKLGQYGEKMEAGTVGQFYCGKLCGCDVNGTLLLCDCGNKRLQIRLPDGQWAMTTLDELSFHPRCAVPVDEHSFLILDCSDVMHLYKFQ